MTPAQKLGHQRLASDFATFAPPALTVHTNDPERLTTLSDTAYFIANSGHDPEMRAAWLHWGKLSRRDASAIITLHGDSLDTEHWVLRADRGRTEIHGEPGDTQRDLVLRLFRTAKMEGDA